MAPQRPVLSQGTLRAAGFGRHVGNALSVDQTRILRLMHFNRDDLHRGMEGFTLFRDGLLNWKTQEVISLQAISEAKAAAQSQSPTPDATQAEYARYADLRSMAGQFSRTLPFFDPKP